MLHRQLSPSLSLLQHAVARRQAHAALQVIDPIHTLSLAWPGAHPLLAAGGLAEQLNLFHENLLAASEGEERGPWDFDPRPFSVRLINGQNRNQILYRFLNEHHYTGSGGMNSQMAFGLYFNSDIGSELVGTCTFARESNPRWAHHTFKPLPIDLDRARLGLLSDQALANRLVGESEYLGLNRLALADRASTRAPLGTGAASWFVSRCLLQIEHRNRMIWAAQTALEQGQRISAEQARLLAEADLARVGRGLGFVKAIATQADPWEGHHGFVYQVLRFHYVGRTRNGRWGAERVGDRSGERISARLLSKAANPAERGHDTAVLRLIWEGGEGEIVARRDGQVLEASDGHWIRGAQDEGQGLQRAISRRWREFCSALRSRHGSDFEICVEHTGGGHQVQRFPSKHRYILMMGAQYWQHELERRHKHLSSRMLERDAAWLANGCWGTLPDTRSEYYPAPPTVDEVKPELRRPVLR